MYREKHTMHKNVKQTLNVKSAKEDVPHQFDETQNKLKTLQ